MTIQRPIQPRILVTGATSGIGHAVAAALARQGAAVVLVGRSHTRLERALAELDGKEHHRLVVADLADDEQVTELAKVAIADGAPLDGLIHCAGTFELTPFEKIEKADLDQTWAINARGSVPAHTSPLLIAPRWGGDRLCHLCLGTRRHGRSDRLRHDKRRT